MAGGMAGERLAERVVPGIMERGGLPAEILQGLAQGSRSQVLPVPTPTKAIRRFNDGGLEVGYGRGDSKILVTVAPQGKNDRMLSASLENIGGYPSGTGDATMAYVDALESVIKDARGRKVYWDGFTSESIQSDKARAIYDRLKAAGIPFEKNVFKDRSKNALSLTQEQLLNINFDQVRNNLIKSAAKKQFSQAPQAEALALAQQRAALPVEQYGLGLPANNTPAQRARAMKFEDRGFHETEGANIEGGLLSFDPRRVGAAASDEQTPYAMFVKPHGAGIGIAKNNPAQMPLMVKTNLTDENIMRSFGNRDELQQYLNQFPDIKQATQAVRDLDNKMANYMKGIEKKADNLYAEGKTKEADKLLDSLNFDSNLLKEFDARTNELAAISKKKITDLFNSQQVGTVALDRDAGAFGRSTMTEMVLNPAENVRSRFAAFDPFRRNAAIAAATGALAPDLLAAQAEQDAYSQNELRRFVRQSRQNK
jgi:hypothetical protein